MDLKRGDIVLVPFPFTDLTSSKVRPAVIVSADPQGEDIIIAFISSVLTPSRNVDFLLAADNPDFRETGLKKDSLFKMDKLLSIHKGLILRYLGRISVGIQQKLNERLKAALGLT